MSAASPPSAGAAGSSPPPPRARLYLADDSRTMRSFYKAILERDYDVSVFEDGEPLLQAARQAPPDVIVSDVNMPELGGLELVRLLKQDASLRPVPVLLLTAQESGSEPGQGGSVDCLDAGADDYLQKPFKPEELMARVRSAHRSFHLYKQLERKHGELAAAYSRLAEMEIELRQAQKLEAVGRLAAGIAHEINTPIQFISDSAVYAKEALGSLTPVLAQYRATLAAAPLPPEVRAALAAAEEDADLAYTLEEAPRALERALAGAQRVTGIVQAMKDFGREDYTVKKHIDLNGALRSTLEVARAEYGAVADLETAFGEIPDVLCQVGAINHVFLNLITNAAHAIADAIKQTSGRGTIRVSTAREADAVVIAVADTGTGIPASIRDRVFDPFFTTKEVGQGSGQGLAIARSIVDKHGGSIAFQTEPGRGTTFFVRLPVAATDDLAPKT
jgi:signal transduction histidine kinase